MTNIEKTIEAMRATLDRIEANNRLQLQALAGLTGALDSTLKGFATLLDIDGAEHDRIAQIDAETEARENRESPLPFWPQPREAKP